MIKKSFSFFPQILKACSLKTRLPTFWALIFIQRLYILNVTFGFHGPPLLTFKTDRLDLRGLDLGKVTSLTHYLKISACKRNLLYMQNTSLKIWKPELPCCISIQRHTHAFHSYGTRMAFLNQWVSNGGPTYNKIPVKINRCLFKISVSV